MSILDQVYEKVYSLFYKAEAAAQSTTDSNPSMVEEINQAVGTIVKNKIKKSIHEPLGLDKFSSNYIFETLTRNVNEEQFQKLLDETQEGIDYLQEKIDDLEIDSSNDSLKNTCKLASDLLNQCTIMLNKDLSKIGKDMVHKMMKEIKNAQPAVVEELDNAFFERFLTPILNFFKNLLNGSYLQQKQPEVPIARERDSEMNPENTGEDVEDIYMEEEKTGFNPSPRGI